MTIKILEQPKQVHYNLEILPFSDNQEEMMNHPQIFSTNNTETRPINNIQVSTEEDINKCKDFI